MEDGESSVRGGGEGRRRDGRGEQGGEEKRVKKGGRGRGRRNGERRGEGGGTQDVEVRKNTNQCQYAKLVSMTTTYQPCPLSKLAASVPPTPRS